MIVDKRYDLVCIGITGSARSTRFCGHLKGVAVGAPEPVPQHFCSPDHRGSWFTRGDVTSSFNFEQRLNFERGILSSKAIQYFLKITRFEDQ